MSKKPELSPKAVEVLNLLKVHQEGLTVAGLKELGVKDVNSAHLVALKRRGLVESVEVEIEVPTVVKRKVQLYTVIKKA